MCIYFGDLPDDQQATVDAIFEDPPRSDIPWFKVLNIFETLVIALGGTTGRFGDFICIGLGSEAEIGGVFPCLSDQECVSCQMIGYLREYLSGVGVEPR